MPSPGASRTACSQSMASVEVNTVGIRTEILEIVVEPAHPWSYGLPRRPMY